MRIKHAVQGGAADAEEFRSAQFVSIATQKNVLDMPANHDVKPPVPQVHSGLCGRFRVCGECVHLSLIGRLEAKVELWPPGSARNVRASVNGIN